MEAQNWLIFIGIGALIIGVIAFSTHFSRAKCSKCGKRNSHAVSRKEIRTERISIKKQERIKHYSKEQTMAGRPITVIPESVSTRNYTVPGIRTFYDVIYTCQNCGEQFSRREYTDTEV